MGLRRRAFRAFARRWAPSLARTPKKAGWRMRVFLRRLEWVDGISRQDTRQLCRMRLEHLRPVTEPLVLISQVQRSGGTLLSRLFDMHPQCHAHPAELAIGYPRKEDWPPLRMDDTPDRWFRTLFEPASLRNLYRGYEKGRPRGDVSPNLPFLFLPSLQRAIFAHCVRTRAVRSPRDILDAYMTSYFNAWLDNENLYRGPKKLVTAFIPRMSGEPKSLASFFSVYPDGKLIAIVRDPRSWYVSVRTRARRVRRIEPAEFLPQWLASTRAIVDAKGTYGPRVRVLGFESLVGDVAGTLRALAEWLEIEYVPSLLSPTFNGFPIVANSSFDVRGAGLIRDPLQRHSLLSAEESRYIVDATADALQAAMRVMD